MSLLAAFPAVRPSRLGCFAAEHLRMRADLHARQGGRFPVWGKLRSPHGEVLAAAAASLEPRTKTASVRAEARHAR
jgi:hypothetical protein